MSNIEIETLIERFEGACKAFSDYPLRLLGLAEIIGEKGHNLSAFDLGRRALAAGANDPEVESRARRLLSSLIPQYHLAMMNDERRNRAWNKAMRRVIRPGAHVLEIGTGGGMLAMMAARAGAGKVTTCECDPVMAGLAREIIERNGYADRIRIICKASQALVLNVDLDQPAELLFCDLFSGSLFGFDPLTVLVDAKHRLLTPGAPVLPASGAVRVALAEWRDYARCGHIDHACGFDVTPLSICAPGNFNVSIGDPDLILRSPDAEAFRFDFAAPSHPIENRTSVLLQAMTPGIVNAIVQWIRLELDAEIVLETRPEAGARYFLAPNVYPLLEPLVLRKGDRVRVGVARHGTRFTVWLAALETERRILEPVDLHHKGSKRL